MWPFTELSALRAQLRSRAESIARLEGKLRLVTAMKDEYWRTVLAERATGNLLRDDLDQARVSAEALRGMLAEARAGLAPFSRVRGARGRFVKP